MVKVKICGLKREEDIEIVNKFKPEFVGFVFAESKRKVSPERAKQLIDSLSKDIKTVGVFVNEAPEKVNEIAEFCGLDVVQLHGDEDALYCEKIKHTMWKAVAVKNEETLDELKGYPLVEGFLLDTYVKGEKGGTGKTFNWDMVKDLYKDYRIILAGGLNPENIGKAIQSVNPYCVDVSSGVEKDGLKNEELVASFIHAVRSTVL